MSPVVLGCDPDLHETALAICDEHRVYAVHVVRRGDDAIEEEATRLMCASLVHEVVAFFDDTVMRCDLAHHERRGVVEGQQFYLGQKSLKGKANPEDLIRLGAVSGAVLAAMSLRGIHDGKTRMPSPAEWKGQLAKHIPQERAWQHYGFPVSYAGSGHKQHARPALADHDRGRILGADEVKPGQWMHVSDAVALALWGATKAWKPKFEKKPFPP